MTYTVSSRTLNPTQLNSQQQPVFFEEKIWWLECPNSRLSQCAIEHWCQWSDICSEMYYRWEYSVSLCSSSHCFWTME